MADVAKKLKRDERAAERRIAIREMVKAGIPVLLIARQLEIAPQQVYNHIRKLRQAGELPSGEGAA